MRRISATWGGRSCHWPIRRNGDLEGKYSRPGPCGGARTSPRGRCGPNALKESFKGCSEEGPGQLEAPSHLAHPTGDPPEKVTVSVSCCSRVLHLLCLQHGYYSSPLALRPLLPVPFFARF